MKSLTLLALAVTVAAAAIPAQAATSIGVSIGINAPGQYGRIDINNYPQAVLYSQQPVIYAPSPVAVYRQPIYLYVAPAHQTNWGRYCSQYGACGQPVHFVREDWVRAEYGREHEQRKPGKAHKNKNRHDNGQKNGRGNGHNGRGN